jgi:hypothetical protein
MKIRFLLIAGVLGYGIILAPSAGASMSPSAKVFLYQVTPFMNAFPSAAQTMPTAKTGAVAFKQLSKEMKATSDLWLTTGATIYPSPIQGIGALNDSLLKLMNDIASLKKLKTVTTAWKTKYQNDEYAVLGSIGTIAKSLGIN